MKLKSIQSYQYVTLRGKNFNFLADVPSMGLAGLQLEYRPDLNAVMVTFGEDQIMVFTTNISCAVPLTEQNAAKPVTPTKGVKDVNPGDKIRR